jgi:hypothetical protein
MIVFDGRTHRLIPLYAVGVFVSFTLSQAGMVRHWFAEAKTGWRWKAAINGVGALATGIVALVIIESKFLLGAWIVLALIPTVVWGFWRIHHHYVKMTMQISLAGVPPEPLPASPAADGHKIVVPVAGLHRASLAALRFARSISADVTGVTVDVNPAVTAKLRAQWHQHAPGIPLVVLPSPFRSVVAPILAYLDAVDRRDPERGLAVVVLPEFVPARWWQNFLHNQTALVLKTALVYRRTRTGRDRVIIDVPYHLRQ